MRAANNAPEGAGISLAIGGGKTRTPKSPRSTPLGRCLGLAELAARWSGFEVGFCGTPWDVGRGGTESSFPWGHDRKFRGRCANESL